jgi:hypothetical protein
MDKQRRHAPSSGPQTAWMCPVVLAVAYALIVVNVVVWLCGRPRGLDTERSDCLAV